jgi:hypothetical protein
VFKAAGSSVEDLAETMKFLNRHAFDASRGNTELLATFFELGINVNDANGRLKGTDKLFLEVADALAKLHEPAAKTAYAMDLLGRSGADALAIMGKGSAPLLAVMHDMQRMGATISAENAEAGHSFDMLTTYFSTGLDVIRQRASAPVLGELAKHFDWLKEQAVTDTSRIGDVVQAMSRRMVNSVVNDWPQIVGVANTTWGAVGKAFHVAEDGAKSFFEYVKSNKGEIAQDLGSMAQIIKGLVTLGGWGLHGYQAVNRAANSAPVQSVFTAAYVDADTIHEKGVWGVLWHTLSQAEIARRDALKKYGGTYSKLHSGIPYEQEHHSASDDIQKVFYPHAPPPSTWPSPGAAAWSAVKYGAGAFADNLLYGDGAWLGGGGGGVQSTASHGAGASSVTPYISKIGQQIEQNSQVTTRLSETLLQLDNTMQEAVGALSNPDVNLPSLGSPGAAGVGSGASVQNSFSVILQPADLDAASSQLAQKLKPMLSDAAAAMESRFGAAAVADALRASLSF